MKNIMKKIVSTLVILVIAVCVTSCKSCKGNKYKYPSVIPTLSNPTATYVTIGDYNITNEMVYYRLLQSYGVNALTTLVEKVTLQDTSVNEEKYNEYLKEYIYGTTDLDSLTQEEQDKAREAFEKNMAALGITTEEGWKDYYRNEYKKIELAVQLFKDEIKAEEEENEKPYFSDEDYENYYEKNYHGTVTIVYATFDSENEAKSMMEKANIDTNNLFGGWKTKAGAEMTAEEIQNAFYTLANVTEATTYTYDELYKKSSTMTLKAYDLEDGEYTHGPVLFGSRYYLLLKVSSTAPEKSLEDAKDEIYEELVDSSIASYYIAAKGLEALNKAELTIYDEGLETLYVNQYNKIYTELGAKEYDEFKTTTEESSSVVASFKYNGQKHEITADQLFAELTKYYGNILVALLVQQYEVLSESKVYNYISGEVLDEKQYNEFYEEDIAEYKEAFLAGEYEENGYPTEYTWENFLRDYFGVLSEKQLLANIDSSLYNYELGKYAEALYLNTEDDETAGIDYLVQQEMKRIYNEYFSGTVTGLKVYYDEDANGIADEIEENSAKAALASELAEKVYANAKALDFDTLAEQLSVSVKLYNMANDDDATYGQYKKAGLIVTVLSNSTYSYTSNQDDKLIAVAKQLWTSIVDLSEELGAASILGTSLDPGVRTVVSSTVHYVTATQFADKVNAVVTEDAAYKLIMVNATARTAVPEEEGVQKFPTHAEYLLYLEDKDTKELSSTTIKLITTYYQVAIANLASEEIVNDFCINNCLELINSNKVVFANNNEANLAAVKDLLNNSKSEEE